MNMCAVAGFASSGTCCAMRLDLPKRAHEAERRSGNRRAPGVGRELARARDRGLDEHQPRAAPAPSSAAASRDWRPPGRPGSRRRTARIARRHHDGRRNRRRHRADEDVAVLHVRELVGEDAVEFLRRQRAQDALGGRDRGVLRVAPGGERVRRRVGNDVDASASAAPRAGASRATDCVKRVARADLAARGTSAGRSCPRRSTRRSSSRRRRRTRARSPCAPPRASPMNSSSALSAARSTVVFSVLDMALWKAGVGRRPPIYGARRSNPATSAALQGSGSRSTCSSAACAPPPMAPSPSRVGTPRAAVKFPSDPPPDPPSPSSRPNSAAMPRAAVYRRTTPARALERRPVHAARDRERGSCQAWARKPRDRRFELDVGVRAGGHADVHVDGRLRAARRSCACRLRSPDVDRDAPLEILQAARARAPGARVR